MDFASEPWYRDTAGTIAALHTDLHLEPTMESVGGCWYRARELGQNADDLKAYLQTLAPLPPPLPTTPSREAVCRVQTTFQGLTVDGLGVGTLPWFDPFLASLDASERVLVYTAK